jgi:hypothetical protein
MEAIDTHRIALRTNANFFFSSIFGILVDGLVVVRPSDGANGSNGSAPINGLVSPSTRPGLEVTKNLPCRFWALGVCRNGDGCAFSHAALAPASAEPPAPAPVPQMPAPAPQEGMVMYYNQIPTQQGTGAEANGFQQQQQQQPFQFQQQQQSPYSTQQNYYPTQPPFSPYQYQAAPSHLVQAQQYYQHGAQFQVPQQAQQDRHQQQMQQQQQMQLQQHQNHQIYLQQQQQQQHHQQQQQQLMQRRESLTTQNTTSEYTAPPTSTVETSLQANQVFPPSTSPYLKFVPIPTLADVQSPRMGTSPTTESKFLKKNNLTSDGGRHTANDAAGARPQYIRPVCSFYIANRCRNRDECNFSHTMVDGVDARTLGLGMVGIDGRTDNPESSGGMPPAWIANPRVNSRIINGVKQYSKDYKRRDFNGDDDGRGRYGYEGRQQQQQQQMIPQQYHRQVDNSFPISLSSSHQPQQLQQAAVRQVNVDPVDPAIVSSSLTRSINSIEEALAAAIKTVPQMPTTPAVPTPSTVAPPRQRIPSGLDFPKLGVESVADSATSSDPSTASAASTAATTPSVAPITLAEILVSPPVVPVSTQATPINTKKESIPEVTTPNVPAVAAVITQATPIVVPVAAPLPTRPFSFAAAAARGAAIAPPAIPEKVRNVVVAPVAVAIPVVAKEVARKGSDEVVVVSKKDKKNKSKKNNNATNNGTTVVAAALVEVKA